MTISKQLLINMISGEFHPYVSQMDYFIHKVTEIINESELYGRPICMDICDDVCYAPYNLNGTFTTICLQDFDFKDYDADSFLYADCSAEKDFTTIMSIPRSWFYDVDGVSISPDTIASSIVDLACKLLND